jgi:16S rRNA (cytidine1402-2'-O)-methyltransferase
VAGTLIICGTPIGNLGDASPRLRDALEAADVVFAEDTRRTSVLLQHLGVDLPARSYFVGNEEQRETEIERRLARGETVAVVSDAGTPGIADPGLTAVRAALRAGATVTVVPGPSAVTAALAVSGLPSDRFVFEGFLPRKGVARRRRLAMLASEERTIVLFAATGRVGRDLVDLAAVLGDERPVTVARELSKKFEEVWRGTLASAARYWSEATVRGEFTLVIGGAIPPEPDLGAALDEVEAAIAAGTPLASAVREIAARHGLQRRALYEATLARRTERGIPDPPSIE